MKHVKLFEDFNDDGLNEIPRPWPIQDGELEWESKFPQAIHNWSPPTGQLYRWIPPGEIEEYFKGTDLEQSGIVDHGQDDDGNHAEFTGIPFFIDKRYFYGMAEPYVRIILDKKAILDDGYTLFNPHRDDGERRIKENIKDWTKYLIAIEVNRDEFVFGPSKFVNREFPMHFKARKKQWDTITKNVPKEKIKVVDDRYFQKEIPWFNGQNTSDTDAEI